MSTNNDLMNYVLKCLNDGTSIDALTKSVDEAKEKYMAQTALDDALVELTASVGEYANAVMPGVKYDVKVLGADVARYIKANLKASQINCYDDMFSYIFDDTDVPTDGKWHNTHHVDKPNYKSDTWVYKK